MLTKPNQPTLPVSDDLFRAIAPSLRKALIILLLPASEFLLMRIVLKHGFALRLGWKYITDWDFIVPVPLALAISILVLERVRPIGLRWSWKALAVNLLSITGFLAISWQFDSLAARSPLLTVIGWVSLGLAFVVSALAVRVSLLAVLTNPNRWVLLPALMIATASIYSVMALSTVWPYFSGWAAAASCSVLEGLVGNVDCLVTQSHGSRMIIRHAALSVSVGKGCGGLDGFFLFSYAALVLWLLLPRLYSPGQWAVLAVLGLPLMFALNVIRICLFFVLAVWCRVLFGFEVSVDLLLAMFHTHCGWLLFFAGIIVYLRAADFVFHRRPAASAQGQWAREFMSTD